MPLEELDYAVYAIRFHWTPATVDELPFELEPWLLPLASLIHDVADAQSKD